MNSIRSLQGDYTRRVAEKQQNVSVRQNRTWTDDNGPALAGNGRRVSDLYTDQFGTGLFFCCMAWFLPEDCLYIGRSFGYLVNVWISGDCLDIRRLSGYLVIVWIPDDSMNAGLSD